MKNESENHKIMKNVVFEEIKKIDKNSKKEYKAKEYESKTTVVSNVCPIFDVFGNNTIFECEHMVVSTLLSKPMMKIYKVKEYMKRNPLVKRNLVLVVEDFKSMVKSFEDRIQQRCENLINEIWFVNIYNKKITKKVKLSKD